EVRAIHRVGKLDLHRLAERVVVLVQVPYDLAVGGDTEVVGTAIARNVSEADGHCRRRVRISLWPSILRLERGGRLQDSQSWRPMPLRCSQLRPSTETSRNAPSHVFLSTYSLIKTRTAP